MFDVAIVGYGPTGLAAASLLARRGHRVCVFERWPTLYGLPRMATIDAESARILQAACDIDRAFARSLTRERYVFATERGEILIDNHWEGLHPAGFPHRISLHQPDIEDAMDAVARAHGAEINQGWEVVGLGDATLAARERATGRERTIEARYVIGADGARSTIRRLLGIDAEVWPVRNAWLTFDATRKRTLPNLFGISPDAQVAAIFCLPEGRSHSVIPLGRDHLRFNFEVDPDTPHDGKLDRALAYERIGAVYGLGPDDVDVYRQAVYPFEGRLARTWRKGRVFLAGDAAHAMTPFLGQGGCSALRDAINLAWKLDFVLRGIAPEALLDTYERERKPHARVYVEGSDKAAALAFVRDPLAAAERDRLYLSGRAPVPPAEPIIEDGLLDPTLPRHRLVGTVGPQFEIEGRRGDDLLGWGFHLLTCAPVDVPPFLERIGARVATMRERVFFRDHAIEAILVRPDFIVFGVAARLSDVPALFERFARALAQSP